MTTTITSAAETTLPPSMDYSMRRTIRSIGIEREGKVYFVEYEEGPLPEGQFRVETLFTGFSAGTELTFYKGTNPFFRGRWDESIGAFRHDQPQAAYPVPFLGYMEVGRVIQSRTPVVHEGQILGMNYGHKTGHTADPRYEHYVPLPFGLDPMLGIYVQQMGPICANGLLHAASDLYGMDVRSLGDGVRGRNVLVIGAGVIGLLTGLFALRHGAARVAVADKTPDRLVAAQNLGLTAINENEVNAAEFCKEMWHDGHERGADVVFQCRANSESLALALRSLRAQGAVIDLAFYQDGLPDVNLGEEFHHNGLTIKCAQINRVPRGLAHTWTRQRLSNETLDLLNEFGYLIRTHMITDVVPYDNAPQLFADVAGRKRNVIQAVFKV